MKSEKIVWIVVLVLCVFLMSSCENKSVQSTNTSELTSTNTTAEPFTEITDENILETADGEDGQNESQKEEPYSLEPDEETIYGDWMNDFEEDGLGRDYPDDVPENIIPTISLYVPDQDDDWYGDPNRGPVYTAYLDFGIDEDEEKTTIYTCFFQGINNEGKLLAAYFKPGAESYNYGYHFANELSTEQVYNVYSDNKKTKYTARIKDIEHFDPDDLYRAYEQWNLRVEIDGDVILAPGAYVLIPETINGLPSKAKPIEGKDLLKSFDIDLDGDGKNEKVRFKLEQDEESDYGNENDRVINLYINDQKMAPVGYEYGENDWITTEDALYVEHYDYNGDGLIELVCGFEWGAGYGSDYYNYIDGELIEVYWTSPEEGYIPADEWEEFPLWYPKSMR